MKTPVFQIDGTELYYVAKNEYKYEFNKLSPFSGQPESACVLGEDTLELLKDNDFMKVVQILAQPSLKSHFNKGGPAGPLESFSAYFTGEAAKKPSSSQIKAVSLHDNNGNLTIILFNSLDEYCEYFAAQNAALISDTPMNVVKPVVSMETMVCLLNLADCYRRAYLNELLADSTQPIKIISETEYLAILERELKSGDVRWLLPSFLRLIPGLGNIVLDFKATQVDEMKSMGFITGIVSPEKGTHAYMLDANAEYMGLEFTHFWKSSVGFELTGLRDAKCTMAKLGQYYLAPTDEANHFIKIITDENKSVGLKVEHRAFSVRELVDAMKTILIQEVFAY